MEQFQYRTKARIIAIIDLVLTSMTLWVPVMLFIGALGVTIVGNDTTLKNDVKEKLMEQDPNANVDSRNVDAAFGAVAIMLWVAFVIVTACVIIQIVAAVKLINAAQIGKDPLEAVKLSRFWRNVTIVFTVLTVLGCLVNPSPLGWIFSTINVILRIIALIFVQRFITELDLAVRNGILPSHHQGQVPMSAGMAYTAVTPNSPPNYDEVVKEKQPY